MPIIPDDEPVFVLRAKDRNAPAVLEFWAFKTENDEDATLETLATAQRVREFADEMRLYADQNYGGGKLADTPPDLLR